MGFIGIFSIGLPLLVAGALACVALILSLIAARQPAGSLKAGAGALLALAIFLGDLRSPSTPLHVRPRASRRVADRAS